MDLPGVKSKHTSGEIIVCISGTHLLKNEIAHIRNKRKKKLVSDEWILLRHNSP